MTRDDLAAAALLAGIIVAIVAMALVHPGWTS